MKPLRTLLAALVLLPALVSPAPALADVIERAFTLPDGLGDGVLFIKDDQDKMTGGIIVVHEWWGLNQYVRNRARMLAQKGYVTLAMDMYGSGKVAAHPKDAKAMMQAALAEPEKLKARFDAAKSILRNQQYVDDKQIFAIGYGFGGGVVLNMARAGEDIAGVAVFHGPLGTDKPMQPDTFKGRVFIATGLADPLVPRQQINSVVEELSHAGVSYELLTFPGAKHAFTNPKADEYAHRFNLPVAYDPEADQRSWDALLGFLSTN